MRRASFQVHFFPFYSSFYFYKQSLTVCTLTLSLFFPFLSLAGENSEINSEQLIFVTAKRGESFGKLFFYEEKEGEWDGIFVNVPVQIGRKGLIPANKKREGDGFTPEGSYPIQRIFGAEKKDLKSLEYTKITKLSFWNHSPYSKYYNQYRTKKEAGSVRLLDFPIYNLFIVVEYNTKPSIPNLGSMIFIHPWEEKYPTSGCIGLPKILLSDLVTKLDGKKNPMLFLVEEKTPNHNDSTE